MAACVPAPAETAEQEWKAWSALIMMDTAPSQSDQGLGQAQMVGVLTRPWHRRLLNRGPCTLQGEDGNKPAYHACHSFMALMWVCKTNLLEDLLNRFFSRSGMGFCYTNFLQETLLLVSTSKYCSELVKSIVWSLKAAVNLSVPFLTVSTYSRWAVGRYKQVKLDWKPMEEVIAINVLVIIPQYLFLFIALYRDVKFQHTISTYLTKGAIKPVRLCKLCRYEAVALGFVLANNKCSIYFHFLKSLWSASHEEERGTNLSSCLAVVYD